MLVLQNNTIRRVINYLVIGSSVAIVTSIINKKKLTVTELFLIACTASTVYLVLDLFTPSIGSSSQYETGSGFGIGGQHVSTPLTGGSLEPFQASDTNESMNLEL